MEALLLFQIYWVCDLKASQITMRWNNDVLGLFFSLAHSDFDWILSKATVFFFFFSQKAVLVLGGLQPAIKAQAFSCEGHGLQSQEMRKKAKGMGGGRGEEKGIFPYWT